MNTGNNTQQPINTTSPQVYECTACDHQACCMQGEPCPCGMGVLSQPVTQEECKDR